MNTSRLAVLVLSGAAALTLAACSSSAAGTGGSAPAVSTAASAGGTTASAAHSSGSPINPCTALTTAQVQPLLTPKLGSSKAGTQPLLKPNNPLHTCTFRSSDGDDLLTVSAYVGDDAATTFDEFRQSEDAPTDVPGVGEKAYRGDENAEVTAVNGNVLCIADIDDAGDVPGADRLYEENGHHTDIGAPAFDIIAKAVGTLCNRIFGSGDTTPALSGLTALHPPAPTD